MWTLNCPPKFWGSLSKGGGVSLLLGLLFLIDWQVKGQEWGGTPDGLQKGWPFPLAWRKWTFR